ncbi:hypothetical protein LEP1GSC067_0178 [Leptospira interrogans serovar Lora str. TE 1992]|uniref:Uncharacterized protein n=1 Tax=Leptospira interrogans serovar Lora str. TE 1992 TaxID=1193028 RepID=M3CHB7_LEPIR|nr:hypothetical protein LEP1GSC067_0178 [Leptospira interrogans serovar Lora str. TE 1992]
MEQKSKLSEALNQYYFERNIPPVLKEILYEIPGYSPELIHQIVDREKFVLIQDSSGDKTESILMYPNDESFRFRAKEIHKVLTEKRKVWILSLEIKKKIFRARKLQKP